MRIKVRFEALSAWRREVGIDYDVTSGEAFYGPLKPGHTRNEATYCRKKNRRALCILGVDPVSKSRGI